MTTAAVVIVPIIIPSGGDEPMPFWGWIVLGVVGAVCLGMMAWMVVGDVIEWWRNRR